MTQWTSIDIYLNIENKTSHDEDSDRNSHMERGKYGSKQVQCGHKDEHRNPKELIAWAHGIRWTIEQECVSS